MATLQVRDLPDQLYRTLADAAERERRSLTQQAVTVLNRGLGLPESAQARRQQVLEQIGGRHRALPADRWPNPVELIREDRER